MEYFIYDVDTECRQDLSGADCHGFKTTVTAPPAPPPHITPATPPKDIFKMLQDRIIKSGRKFYCAVTGRQLKKYRKCETIEEIVNLDKALFAKNKQAFALERPLQLCEMPATISRPGLPGKVIVVYISDDSRGRFVNYSPDVN